MKPQRLWRWAAGHQFLAALIVFTLVVAGGLVRDFSQSAARDREVACIQSWADDVVARSRALLAAGTPRADAEEQLWREIARQIITGPPDRAAFQRQLTKYLELADQYHQRQRENPVPDSPRIRC